MINNLALKFDGGREGKQIRLELARAWLEATGPDTTGFINKVYIWWGGRGVLHLIWNKTFIWMSLPYLFSTLQL